MRPSRQAAVVTALLSGLLALPAHAGKAKVKPKAPAAAPAPPREAPRADAKAVAALMGKFKWGLAPEEVLGVLEEQIAARYADALKKTTDIYEQNRIRKQIKVEVDAIRKTQVKFDGHRSGWDVSIVEREFAQKDDESMMLYQDTTGTADAQRFFFFVDGKLWKIFLAFNMAPYKDKTFDDFRKAMEARYGRAAEVTKEVGGVKSIDYIYWRSSGVYLRAINLLQFYGNFCLAISDDSVEKSIGERRATRNPAAAPQGSVVDVMTDEKSKGAKVTDPNTDIVKRITESQPGPAPTPAPDKQ